MTLATTALYRPAGPKEMVLIARANFKAFPCRLPEQPIFYPVLNVEYACQIAQDWNVREMNRNIVGKIEVIAEYVLD
jgi:hypothetical protein